MAGPDGREGYDELRPTLSKDAVAGAISGTGTEVPTGSEFRSVGPSTHRLPYKLMWAITLLTASSMAVINFCTIWVISFAVEFKFNTVQAAIDRSTVLGIGFFVCFSMLLASLNMALIFGVAPSVGSSGAPENKGWLNGNSLPGFFTARNLVCRQLATMLANMSGYPVGREGPTVTMGSNLAFLITHRLALPHVRQWVELQDSEKDTRGYRYLNAMMIDEEQLEFAKRIVCTVGGACGMAMLFDSPVGGIVYMFEEITSSSWPMEVTMRAFVGTTVCSVLSRGLLNLCGTTTKAFVVYEFHPRPNSWSWVDLPFFVLLALFLGAFSAFHTRACLAVAGFRQRQIAKFGKALQTPAKIFDAILFIAVCALTYAVVSLQAECFDLPDGERVEYVRYNCPAGHYNPVASLLLTTSEGAVKRLFSNKNADQLHLGNECLSFLAYTLFNICLTGVSVPSGNFTGSMLIGGLIGRIMGAGVQRLGVEGLAVSGIYAMIGSAAMLSGFKQMCVAVVVFITGCANDLNLVPPLMVSITFALFVNREINERGFDEEQIVRKKIPFLPGEPPRSMDFAAALDLVDSLPENGHLGEEVPAGLLQELLESKELADFSVFPVVKEATVGQVCVGFATRERLKAALKNAEFNFRPPDEASPSADQGNEMQSLMTRNFVRASFSLGSDLPMSAHISASTLLPVARLVDKCPYTVLEDMPAPRVYALFSRAGAPAASVISESGAFRGMISKDGLIGRTRAYEEEEVHVKTLRAKDRVSVHDVWPAPRGGAAGPAAVGAL